MQHHVFWMVAICICCKSSPIKRLCFTAEFIWLQVAQSYGLLLGTIVMIPKTAQTLAAILMLTFILTGGYFVRGQFWAPVFVTGSMSL